MSTPKRKGCAICGRPIEVEFRPFCSKRCADVDLGRWFGERYVVPGPPATDDKASVPGDDDGEGGD